MPNFYTVQEHYPKAILRWGEVLEKTKYDTGAMKTETLKKKHLKQKSMFQFPLIIP